MADQQQQGPGHFDWALSHITGAFSGNVRLLQQISRTLDSVGVKLERERRQPLVTIPHASLMPPTLQGPQTSSQQQPHHGRTAYDQGHLQRNQAFTVKEMADAFTQALHNVGFPLLTQSSGRFTNTQGKTQAPSKTPIAGAPPPQGAFKITGQPTVYIPAPGAPHTPSPNFQQPGNISFPGQPGYPIPHPPVPAPAGPLPQPPTSRPSGQQPLNVLPVPQVEPRKKSWWEIAQQHWDIYNKKLQRGKDVSGYEIPAQRAGDALGMGRVVDLGITGARAAAGDPTAMAGLVEKAVEMAKAKIEQAKQGARTTGRHAWGTLTSDRAGEFGGHVFGMGEGLGHAIGGPGGKAIEGASKLGKALAESVDRLRDWSRHLNDSNMQFAEFSAAMAGVEARQYVREIGLSRERGNRRAASADYLNERRTDLEKQITPFEDAFANLKSYLAGAFLERLTDLIRPIREWAEQAGLIPGSAPGGNKGLGAEISEASKKPPWHEDGRPGRLR